MSENQGNAAVELSAEEQAYFESGGEAELKEAPAVVTPEPEQPQAANPEEPQQPERDDKGRFVPHQALHAEREEHKKTKAEVESVKQQLAVLNDRWNTLLQLRQQQDQPQEETPPDPEQDIFGFAKWQADRLKSLEAKLSDQEKQTEQQRQIEQQERGIWDAWKSSVVEYSQQAPEFGDAAQFLSDLRAKQLQAFSSIDPRFASVDGINQQINNELRAIVIQALQAGASPAKFVHDLAVSNGFQPKAPDPANVQMPEKLANVAAAQEAARTVGASPGRSGGDTLTPEAIAAMSAAEFDRWAADPANARLLDKMLGA